MKHTLQVELLEKVLELSQANTTTMAEDLPGSRLTCITTKCSLPSRSRTSLGPAFGVRDEP